MELDALPGPWAYARYLTHLGVDDAHAVGARWLASCIEGSMSGWIEALGDECDIVLFSLPERDDDEGLEVTFSSESYPRFVREVALGGHRLFELVISRPAPNSVLGFEELVSVRWTQPETDAPHEFEIEVISEVARLAPGVSAVRSALIETAKVGKGNGAFWAQRLQGPINPFERGTLAQGSALWIRDAEHWLQGVYWGNLLGPAHIERLGGLDRVIEDQPGAFATVIPGEHGSSIYIQVSDEPKHCTLEQMQQMHTFLIDVLPEPFRDPQTATRLMEQGIALLNQTL